MLSKSRSRLLITLSLRIGLMLPTLLAITLGSALGQDEKTKGKWQSPPIVFPNVPIHAHVLPTGKVLFWGRRAWKDNAPVNPKADGLNEQDTSPFLWDPLAKDGAQFTPLPKPGFNMFCSGHTFLADGRLLVIGGHIADQKGTRKAALYNPFDPVDKSWTATADMNAGRWYPNAITLPDGSVLATFGSNETKEFNKVLQIWKDGKWTDNVFFGDARYYPRMHVVPDGRVFMTGPLNLTQFLDPNTKQWTPLGNRTHNPDANALMEYAPSVLYNEGKIVFIGGGQPPSNSVKKIDLKQPKPAWQDAKKNMAFPRIQHNGTILPDGTVLVTGGTRGQGGPSPGFNDLSKGMPVHTPELWDPVSEKWTKMADEAVDRCYHSTAILLPDGRVVSGGGGEYFPTPNNPNPLTDSHANAQIFSPPYLCQGGVRPAITKAADKVAYKSTFDVETSNPDDIAQVNWIRLSSTTHSFNFNQRINFLKFTSDGKKLTVVAPESTMVCPPGHYMLFILNKAKVPSVAKIINIQ